MLLDMSSSLVKVGFMQLHQPNLFTRHPSLFTLHWVYELLLERLQDLRPRGVPVTKLPELISIQNIFYVNLGKNRVPQGVYLVVVMYVES